MSFRVTVAGKKLRAFSGVVNGWVLLRWRGRRAVVLDDEDAAVGDEAAGGGAGGFREGFPVAAGGVGFVAGVAGD